jgi:hypothetical protein
MKMILLLISFSMLYAAEPGRVESRYSDKEYEPTADPTTEEWKGIKPFVAELDRYGKPVPHHRTEIRTFWTNEHLYILFVCPYRDLNTRPNPSTTMETNRLWLHDVAEVFIGYDANNIDRYKEYQVSPRGEWVDLDIDRQTKNPDGWKWNSGMQVKARINRSKRIWYGEMKIPIKSFDPRPVQDGSEVRINFYRIQGSEPNRIHVNWQPVHAESFHTPQAFGKLVFRK